MGDDTSDTTRVSVCLRVFFVGRLSSVLVQPAVVRVVRHSDPAREALTDSHAVLWCQPYRFLHSPNMGYRH